MHGDDVFVSEAALCTASQERSQQRAYEERSPTKVRIPHPSSTADWPKVGESYRRWSLSDSSEK